MLQARQVHMHGAGAQHANRARGGDRGLTCSFIGAAGPITRAISFVSWRPK